jgi:hypothetical protein
VKKRRIREKEKREEERNTIYTLGKFKSYKSAIELVIKKRTMQEPKIKH